MHTGMHCWVRALSGVLPRPVSDMSLLATASVLTISWDSSLDPNGISVGGVLSTFSSFCCTILFRSLSLTLEAAPRLWASSLPRNTSPLSSCNTAQGDSSLVSHPGNYISSNTKPASCESCWEAFVWSQTALVTFALLQAHQLTCTCLWSRANHPQIFLFLSHYSRVSSKRWAVARCREPPEYQKHLLTDLPCSLLHKPKWNVSAKEDLEIAASSVIKYNKMWIDSLRY